LCENLREKFVPSNGFIKNFSIFFRFPQCIYTLVPLKKPLKPRKRT
jgi:hypothetical protein